jgi:acetylornithine deacetylase/succinyl-diaminopimelate desuccinylase-like protein
MAEIRATSPSLCAAAVMGVHGIPCIGSGPGKEVFAHAATEQVSVEHFLRAAARYAAFPGVHASAVSPR